MMIKFIVRNIKIKDKKKGFTKIHAQKYEDDDIIDIIIICEYYYNFTIGNEYLAEVIKYDQGDSIVENVVKCGVDKIVLKEANGQLQKIMNKDDIEYYLNIDSMQSIIDAVKLNKYDDEKKDFAIDTLFHFKNKDKLINLKDKYKLKNEMIGFFLSKDCTKDIVDILINKPYMLVRFENNNSNINKIKKDNDTITLSNILRSLYKDCSRGHIFSYLRDVKNEFTDIDINKMLSILENDGLVSIEEDRVYLTENYLLEDSLINNLLKRREIKNTELTLEDNEKVKGIIDNSVKVLDLKQQEAIFTALTNNISTISGGAGSGKTFTICTLVACIKALNKNISIASLAGKAVNVINLELNNLYISATTIHRFLNKKEDEFYEINKIKDIDYLIIDETSILDLKLFSELFESLELSTKIILVGDTHQLEPVGMGQVFKDIKESNTFSITILNGNHRQKDKSLIAKNAEKLLQYEVNCKYVPNFEYKKYENEEFKFVPCKNTEISNQILNEIEILQNNGYNLDDITILTPVKQGANGVAGINKKIADRYFPYEKINKNLSINNKVIQTKNDYNLEVFNGEIGKITYISEEFNDTTLIVDYGYKKVKYKKTVNLDLAYALTIHKMQGSSNKVIILAVDEKKEELFNTNLIYVAITRAIEKVIIIGNKQTFDEAVIKVPPRRNSMLLERLKG
ncbi:MAG: AAA family ATPase [Clostridium sp.]|uniref:ATP-dependent DNA helicase n=1 Tax=Clostridium sp. TaxID=1506 RepID=UPI0025BBDEED|nr:AAA family ATPase [Clostridium sp.]MCE5221197.1 AAA family ATPase [Clostridium sp.]